MYIEAAEAHVAYTERSFCPKRGGCGICNSIAPECDWQVFLLNTTQPHHTARWAHRGPYNPKVLGPKGPKGPCRVLYVVGDMV